jgi:hypothetical protein
MDQKQIDDICTMFNVRPGESQAIELVTDLENANIKRLEIVRRHNEPAPDEPKRPLGSKRYVVFDSDALIKIISRFAKPDEALIVYDNEQIVGLFDAGQISNYASEYDAVRMMIRTHDVFDRWEKAISSGFDHDDLLKFLRRQARDIVDADALILSWSKVKTTIGLERQAAMDDGAFKSVVFQSKTGSTEPAKLLCEFTINIPVLEGDEKMTTFQVSIDIIEPDSPTGRAMFELRSWKFDYALHDAVKLHVAKVQEQLPEFTIVHGDGTNLWFNNQLGKKK